MFVVIYSKKTKRILQVLEQNEGMQYGYSEGCAEAIVNEKPSGKFFNEE